MMRSKRIDPLEQMADMRERDAARLLGETHRLADVQKQSLVELRAFRAEYARRFQNEGSRGLSISKLHDYRAFLGQLNEAIAHQERQLEDTQRNLAQKQNGWLDARARKQALNTVLERFRQQEMQEQARKEQQEADERGQRGRRLLY